MSVDLDTSTGAAVADAALQDSGRADSLTDPLSSASALGDSLEDGGDAVQMVEERRSSRGEKDPGLLRRDG